MILAFMMEGGHLSGLWGSTAFIIVIGGTIGATALSSRMADLKRMGKAVKLAFFGKDINLVNDIKTLEGFSKKARRDGLLALEQELNAEGLDEFIRDGLSIMIDGAHPDFIKAYLEIVVDEINLRHKGVIAIFEAAGGYAPTMGIIGTVMGLVHVLSNLSDPSTLGGSIAVAFLATLYGIATANLIWLPIGAKLKSMDAAESNQKYMLMEGILSIANGENPTMMLNKMKVFLPKDQLRDFDKLMAKGEEK